MINLGQIEPLLTPSANRMEIYNSFSVLLLTYCLLCLTNFVPDAEARYNVGFGMIALTGQNILVNIYLISRTPLRQLFLKCKARWVHRAIVKKNWKFKMSRTLTKLKSSVGMSPRAGMTDRSGGVLETIHESENED